MNKYFITGIDTDSGKTLVSAIITKGLQADYWKPIQAGIEITDKETVKKLVNNTHCVFWDEQYLLKSPMSPHAAAKIDEVTIDLNKINLPQSSNDNFVIEGAGGILVPLNDNEFVIDVAIKLNCEVILVADLYLGSINHTLLSFEALKKRNINVKGIIFNGAPNEESERIILKHSGYKKLLHILPEPEITEYTVQKYAIKLFENWD